MVVHAGQLTVTTKAPVTRGGMSVQMLEDGILAESMDGTVLNLLQWNPSPERDSLIEHLEHAVLTDDRAESLRLIQELKDVNSREGERFKSISRVADDAISVGRTVRTQIVGTSGNRAVAKLTGPLGCLLADPQGFKSAQVVVDVIRTTPVSVLRSKHVRHQLGKRKMAKLERFLGDHQ